MSYLNCPRCGLSVHIASDHDESSTCPRCLGRAGLRIPMYETERPRPPVSQPAGDAPTARPEPQLA